jgi:hypothetical protein
MSLEKEILKIAGHLSILSDEMKLAKKDKKEKAKNKAKEVADKRRETKLKTKKRVERDKKTKKYYVIDEKGVRMKSNPKGGHNTSREAWAQAKAVMKEEAKRKK